MGTATVMSARRATPMPAPTPRRWLLPLLVLVLALGRAPAGHAAEPEGKDATLYQGLLPSTLWINLIKKREPTGKVEFLSGSGVLVDRKQGLVLTNRHVVRDKDEAFVLFPAYPLGHLRRDRPFYMEQILRGIKGKVIARDAPHDLALIQLEWVPPGAKAVRLASHEVVLGDRVYSLGNPGDSKELWVFRAGDVRQLLHEKFHSKTNDGFESEVDSDIILTDSPNRPGESGGPLINARGELEGLIHGDRTVKTAAKESHFGLFIDLKEIRIFLNSRKVAAKPAAPPPDPPATPHVKAASAAHPARAPAAADDPEETAARRLKLARSLVTDGVPARAVEPLKEIIKHFPTTKAAGEARELLDKLNK
jgi:hypothetical protein